LTYQWTQGGVNIPGATNAFLVTGPLTVTTSYAVTVSNPYGTVTSPPVTVTVGAAVTYQARVLSDGAVAYWPLDDASGTTARDLVGTRPATITGGVTLNQPGIGTSKAMLFPLDGLGKLTPLTFPALGSAFTLEVWIQPSVPATFGSQRALMMRPIGGDGDFQWYVRSSLSEMRFLYYSVVYFTLDLAVPLAIGNWVHLALTGASGQVTLYINGLARPAYPMTLAGAGTVTSAIGGSTEAGAETWGWRGAMQDVAVYARPLTPAEIVAHYTTRIS